MSRRRPLLTFVASHPIPYFVQLYRQLALRPELDIQVLYCRDAGASAYFDRGFDRAIRWDDDLLAGYPARVLLNFSPIQDTYHPAHALNPGVIPAILARSDAIHVIGYWYPTNFLAAAAALVRGAKILFRCDLRDTVARPPRPHDPLRDRVVRAWLARANAILYIGSENRRAFEARGAAARKLVCCPYTIEFQRFARDVSSQQRRALRRKYGIPPDSVVVLMSGKLTPVKNPALLIDACAAFAHSKVFGVFAGSGPMEKDLRAEAQIRGVSNLRFLGFLDQKEMPSVYGLADILFFPSRNDTWGFALVEGMASGLPAVVSNAVGAAVDLVTPGKSGLIVPAGDRQASLEALRTLIESSTLRLNMGIEARKASRGYDVETSVQGVLEALRRVGLLPSSV